MPDPDPGSPNMRSFLPPEGGNERTNDLAAVVAAFGQLLHEAGVPVSPERAGRFAKAVTLAPPVSTDEVYWAGRVTLLTAREQIPVYDAVFAQVFRGMADPADSRGDTANQLPPNVTAGATPPPPPGSGADAERRSRPGGRPSVDRREGEPDPDDRDAAVLRLAGSASERLAHKDFAACTPEELAAIRSLVAALAVAPPPRPSRRQRRHPLGRRLDLRGTLRRSRRTGGDPVDWLTRRQKERPRRLVLIADVSGSMEPYSRTFLHLLHSAVRAARAEAFVFATRLTRTTRALADTNPDVALRRAARAAPDWSGGTRMGEALAAFNNGWGRRGIARGSVVVIVSDGWECGDPKLVGQEMERLSRLAYRIIWVNPRSASTDYQPLVGGMAAALPFVDALVSGHSLAALEELIAAIGSEETSRRRVGAGVAALPDEAAPEPAAVPSMGLYGTLTKGEAFGPWRFTRPDLGGQ